MDEIGAVGHRVVASGEYFKKTTLVTPEVLKTLEEKTFELGPCHYILYAAPARQIVQRFSKAGYCNNFGKDGERYCRYRT